MNDGLRDRIGYSEAFIINIPAFLFLGLTPLSVIIFRLERFSWLALFPLVWGLSGFILLISDYFNRKKDLYLRLTSLNQEGISVAYACLKGTLCGYCMKRALRLRFKLKGVCI